MLPHVIRIPQIKCPVFGNREGRNLHTPAVRACERMSNRHAVRARKIPVSVTLSPDDYDFLEMLVNTRRVATRTHAIERAIQLLREEFQMMQALMAQQRGMNGVQPQQPQQPPNTNRRPPH